MAIIKCKMCGGDMEIAADKTFGTCEYCGTAMTLPKVDDEQRAAAFNRGNHFRRIGEFDKALAVYERIVQEDNTDAEAHWCCALCRFGIEYVEDPATYEWLPTCHRASFDSFLEDVDYKAALEYSDGITRRQYQKDAAKIAEVQRGILATSQNAEPFDVFICYKESDENGQRTRDSLLAQDIYYQLTEQGRRVFFARLTLEDVAGTQYEPYIFAALNSAKVMVVVGTKPEYLNAVWVKNEWSRFLAMMKKDHSKLLLPCFRDMDPYDLPEQLSVLQSYDMSKIGFIQDLTRGIAKVLDAEKPVQKETVVVQQSGSAVNVAPLLERVFMFLEDGNWAEADTYCEKVLDQEPKNAQAYLGKLMAELRVKQQANLANCEKPFDERGNYKKALRFADDKLAAELKGYITQINKRNEEARLNNLYTTACSRMNNANTEDDYLRAAESFEKISGYRDSKEKAVACRERAAQCKEQAEIKRKDVIYTRATQLMERATFDDYLTAIKHFEKIPDWKDANEKIVQCQQRIEEIKTNEHQAVYQRACGYMAENTIPRYEQAILAFESFNNLPDGWKDHREKIELCKQGIKALKDQEYDKACACMAKGTIAGYEEAIKLFNNFVWRDSKEKIAECKQRITDLRNIEIRAAKKKKKCNTILILTALVLIAAAALAYVYVLQPMMQYNKAEELLAAGDYDGAIAAFEELGDYKDSAERVLSLWYSKAEILLAAGDQEGAIAAFVQAEDYKDAAERVLSLWYSKAETLLAAGDQEGAITAFARAEDYKDASERIAQIEAAEKAALEKIRRSGIHFIDASLHAVAVRNNGTVWVVGRNQNNCCDLDGWSNIESISAAELCTIGVKKDGTVLYRGFDERCDISDWNNICMVDSSRNYVAGLRTDGSVLFEQVTSGQHNALSDIRESVAKWSDIAAISSSEWHMVGLKSDGTVVAAGDNYGGRCDVDSWKDIVAISSGWGHTVGLKSDGTVVAVGVNDDGQCNVSGWSDIVAISTGYNHTVGLKSDGTVVAVGKNDEGRCDVGDWTDIIAIAGGYDFTVAVRSDDTVVATGNNHYGVYEVSNWTDIKLPTA